MARVLLLVLLGAVVFLLVRALRRAGTEVKTPPPVRAQEITGQMVACAYCGLHLPESEAIRAQGHAYCCDAHGLLGPAGQ